MDMKNNYEIDRIIKQSLKADCEPDLDLNNDILRQWKENDIIKKKEKRKFPAAAAIVLCILAVSATVGAAAKYLSISELTKEFSQPEVYQAFQDNDAIEVNETKVAGDYKFTFLGIASGKAIVQSELTNQLPENSQTYAVLAIERKDGTPMPQISDDSYSNLAFCVSPLIEGLNPMQYNIFCMDGGYSDCWKNGVLYRIVESDELQKFADKHIYLAVTDTDFWDNDAFEFDKKSGKITENKAYDGINLLFDIPYDPSKADPKAAKQYLEKFDALYGNSKNEETVSKKILTVEEVLDNKMQIKDSVQTLKKERNAYLFHYTDSNGNEKTVYIDEDVYFPNDKVGWSDELTYFEDETGISYVLFYKQTNGSITGYLYQ
jgi:hypothetical protein